MIINMSVVEKAKKEQKMFYETNRLETFVKWHFTDDKPCSRKKLAEAGFYFIGTSKEPDAVECFYCKKALDGWDEDDDPWLEHQNHSSDCDFAKLRKPEGELTLDQLIHFKNTKLSTKWKSDISGAMKIYEDRKILKIISLCTAAGVRKR